MEDGDVEGGLIGQPPYVLHELAVEVGVEDSRGLDDESGGHDARPVLTEGHVQREVVAGALQVVLGVGW